MGTEAFTEVQRRLRQRLVNAAEELARAWFQDPEAQKRENKKENFSSQLSQLQYACASAACAEEIECFVRYQIGRQVWPVQLGDRVLARVKQVLDDTEISAPAEQVEAWRLLATYLKRAYIYQRERRKDEKPTDAPAERERREEAPRLQRQDGPSQRRRP